MKTNCTFIAKISIIIVNLTSNALFGQITIASDGFNGSASLFSAGGAYYNGNSASNDRPASTQFQFEGTDALGSSNTSLALTTGNINTIGYDDIELSLKTAAFSLNNTSGLDGTDYVTIAISPNGGTNFYSTLRIKGFNQSYWSFIGGTTLASTAYDGNVTIDEFGPTATVANTAEGFTTMKITNLPAVNNLQIRITLLNDHPQELWLIDDFKLTGCKSPIVAASSKSGANTSTQCVTSGGWTYYGDGTDNYFSISKGGTGLTGETIDIEVLGSPIANSSQSGVNKEHASYLMARGWNVTGTIPSGTVMVRFPYNPADTVSAKSARDAAYNTLKTVTNVNTLAIKSSAIEWFKTTNVPYNTAWRATTVGNKFPSNYLKLSPTYGSANGVSYVQFTVTSFSGGTGGYAYGPPNGGGTIGLPVKWASFDVKAAEEGNVLAWQTASENNSAYFELEYSYDGESFHIGSGKIWAAGNSTTLNSYSYTHVDFTSILYYRIKQVDINDRFEYSETKVLKRNSEYPLNVSLYPIPVSEDNLINLMLRSIDKSLVVIEIIDFTGAIVHLSKQILENDSMLLPINISHLQSGLYIIRVKNGQGTRTFRIAK